MEAELLTALRMGCPPVTVWSPEADMFGNIIDETPHSLREAKLYDTLAIEWRGGMHRGVSIRQVARALGAQELKAGSARRLKVAARWRSFVDAFGGGRQRAHSIWRTPLASFMFWRREPMVHNFDNMDGPLALERLSKPSNKAAV